MIEKLIPAIFALLGTIIGATGTIIVTFINKKTEEKKQLRELAFKAGIENWKEACDLAKRQNGIVYPLDMFILNMKLLSEKLLETRVKKEHLKDIVQEINEINAEYEKILKQNQANKKREGDIIE